MRHTQQGNDAKNFRHRYDACLHPDYALPRPGRQEIWFVLDKNSYVVYIVGVATLVSRRKSNNWLASSVISPDTVVVLPDSCSVDSYHAASEANHSQSRCERPRPVCSEHRWSAHRWPSIRSWRGQRCCRPRRWDHTCLCEQTVGGRTCYKWYLSITRIIDSST